mgnify:FL=1
MTGLAIGIYLNFKEHVAENADLGIVRYTKPLLYASEVVVLFSLGHLYNHYATQGAAFTFIFLFLLFMKLLAAVAFSYITTF